MPGKRESELKILNEYSKRSGNQLLILYGEEGIGKTSLLQEFTKEFDDVVCFNCSIVSEREQLYMWGRDMKGQLNDLPEYPSFADVLWKYHVLTDL